MCANYGYFTIGKDKLTKEQIEKRTFILQAVAVQSEVRGTDATGLFNSKKSVKNIYKASDFLVSKDATPLFNDFMLIGHNRWATTGANTTRNAHPFTFGSIIGVHNGQVSNWEQVKDDYADLKDVEVDSEVIFYLLDKYKDDYTKAFKELRGSMAIVWWNIQTKTLQFLPITNSLYVVYIPDLHTYFWASVGDYLTTALLPVYGLANTLAVRNLEQYKIHSLQRSSEEIEAGEFVTLKPYETVVYPKSSYFSKSTTDNSKAVSRYGGNTQKSNFIDDLEDTEGIQEQLAFIADMYDDLYTEIKLLKGEIKNANRRITQARTNDTKFTKVEGGGDVKQAKTVN